MKLVCCRGLVAAGKTCWAREQQEEAWKHGKTIVAVSKDELRAMLHNGHYSRHNEAQVVDVETRIVTEALSTGNDVIVHDTNFNSGHVDRWRALAHQFLADFELRDFPIDVEEAIKRDAKRPNSVGAKVIRAMAARANDGQVLSKPNTNSLPYVTAIPDRSTFNRLFFTSDLHEGHEANARWRGFVVPNSVDDEHPEGIGDTAAMSAAIRQAICERVTDGDLVLLLGDAAMGQRQESLKFYDDLPGTWMLLPGNHDHLSGWHHNPAKWWDLYASHFAAILKPELDIELKNGQTITLSHFPFGTLDHTDIARFLNFRPRDRGQYLIHGHTHSVQRRQGERMIHIGVDAWNWGPVSEDEVIAMIEEDQK